MVPFLLNSKIFLTLLSVSIVDFEQVKACSSERALAHTIDRDFANFFSMCYLMKPSVPFPLNDFLHNLL